MNKITLTVIALLLSGCIVTAPDATRTPPAVPPVGFTPSSLAAQKIIASADKTDAQRAADEAARYEQEVLAAIAQATAVSQATQAAHEFSVRSTQDALSLAAAQHAATATAQAIDAAVQATREANAVQATQTAQALAAKKAADDQMAYERKLAFEFQAQQNQADRDRVKTSSDFMAGIFILGAIGLVGGFVVLFLALGNRIAQSVAQGAQATAHQKSLVSTRRGDYIIKELPDGSIVLTPAYQLAAPQQSSNGIDEDNAIDQEPEQKQETFIDTRTGTDIKKMRDDYRNAQRGCQANAVEILLASIDYWNAQGLNGQAYNKLPGYRLMKAWSENWKSSSKWDWRVKPIRDYFVSQEDGEGLVLTDGHPSLYSLCEDIKSGAAPVKVYGRDPANGNPVPLSPV